MLIFTNRGVGMVIRSPSSSIAAGGAARIDIIIMLLLSPAHHDGHGDPLSLLQTAINAMCGKSRTNYLVSCNAITKSKSLLLFVPQTKIDHINCGVIRLW